MAGKRSTWLRIVAWVAVPLIALPVGVAGFLAASGQSVPLPRPVLDMAQKQVDLALRRAGTVGAQVRLGGVSFAIDRGFRPRVAITDIRLSDREGTPVMVLPEARATFHHPTFSRPVPWPRAVVLDGARLYVQRREDGSFDVGFGIPAGESPIRTYPEAMEEFRRALTVPLIDNLRHVELRDVTAMVDDARAGRVWELDEGSLILGRVGEAMEITLSARVAGEGRGRVGLNLTLDPAAGTTALSAGLDDFAARDIAALAPPLAGLNLLQSDVSGTLKASVDAQGALATFGATLDLGPGALQPRPGMRSIPFDTAALALTYDPTNQKVSLIGLNVQGPFLRVEADGHSYLRDMNEGLPSSVVTQLRFQNIAVDPRGEFTEPVRFSSGMLDMRLRLDPFTVDIGQLVLSEEDRILRARGRVRAEENGWRVSFDPELNRIRRDQLLALWPVRLVPRARSWLDENVLEGDLRNVRAAIRIAPETEARLSLSYDFSGGDVRFLRTLPPIEEGEGYASIHDDRYAMRLQRGHVTPPEGGVVTADGSTLVVPDFRDQPIRVDIGLVTESSVTAALSLLDQEPFRFLTRAGRDPHIGTGHASVRTRLIVPLVADLDPDQVDFDVTGDITGFASDSIVAGKRLTAPRLRLVADPEELAVGGEGLLGKVAFDATYRLPLQGDAPSVEGRALLSQLALDEFGIALPDGLLRGKADGNFRVALPGGAPPELRLTSDLRGVAAGLPAIGWSKAANAPGALEVEATLGPVPEVSRLHVEGGGLAATGAVSLTEAGTFDALRMSRVRLNGWLDAPVTLTSQGAGQPIAVGMNGGRIDLRKLDIEGGDDAGGDAIPITGTLDEVRVTDTLALTDVRGDFNTGGGFQGRFEGRVNGGTPVSGEAGPSPDGTSVHLVSRDAGGVLRSAGIIDQVRGGVVDLRLTPRAAKGEYDGQVVAGGLRVVDLPAVAGVVNGLSGVGAGDQLANGGILFDKAVAAFRLTPDAIEVARAEATGPSLGVTSEGVYRMADKRFFMQGVVTPVWFLNGAGSANGEGLFGVTYTLRGTTDDPEIGANPLTLLAPGALRDLFRNPAPRLAE